MVVGGGFGVAYGIVRSGPAFSLFRSPNLIPGIIGLSVAVGIGTYPDYSGLGIAVVGVSVNPEIGTFLILDRGVESDGNVSAKGSQSYHSARLQGLEALGCHACSIIARLIFGQQVYELSGSGHVLEYTVNVSYYLRLALIPGQ